MPNLSFQTLLNRAVRKCGLDPLTLSQSLADSFADWIQERVQRCWIRTTWPETLTIEQREFAPAWASGTYAAGAIVWYGPGPAYYQAGSSGCTTADVPGASANWTQVNPPKNVALAQPGQTVIGECLNVWRDDPRAVRGPREIGFWTDAENIWVDPRPAVAQPWIQFRVPAPQFSATPFDATQAYAAGEVYYYSDGNCYLCLETTNPGDTPGPLDTYIRPDGGTYTRPSTEFALQQCPHTIADYAVRAVKADWFSDDGQDEKAMEAEQLAEMWLADRLADLTILQRQTMNYTARY